MWNCYLKFNDVSCKYVQEFYRKREIQDKRSLFNIPLFEKAESWARNVRFLFYDFIGNMGT